MKKAALILAALALLAGVLAAYQAFNEELTVTGTGVSATDASDASDAYDAWTRAVAGRQFLGITYGQSAAPKESSRFVTYTLRLRNRGLLPADMVELQLMSDAGDVASYQSPDVLSIGAGEEKTLSLTLLTREGTGLRRDLLVTYYVWGRHHALRYTLTGQ